MKYFVRIGMQAKQQQQKVSFTNVCYIIFIRFQNRNIIFQARKLFVAL